jgi:hypothetical protein
VAAAASAAPATAVAPAASAASEPAKPESSEADSANASAPSDATGEAQASEPAASAEQADAAAVPASAAADRSAKSDARPELEAAQGKEVIELGAEQPLRLGLSSEERAEAVRQAKLLRSQTPAPVVKPTKVYALVTSLTGTRAASERRLRMMGLSFAGGKISGDLRSEIMKVDKGWRATLWPFTSRKEAEAARDMLADRGVYTEVLAFCVVRLLRRTLIRPSKMCPDPARGG